MTTRKRQLKIHIWQGMPSLARHNAPGYVACGANPPDDRILSPESIPAGGTPEDIGVTCLACLDKFRGC